MKMKNSHLNYSYFLGIDIGKRVHFATLTVFAGIDPKLKESGKSKGQTVMSKRGSKHLRTALFQASLVASVWDPMFKSIYKKHKDKGKHHHVVLSHVARKMTHVIYSLLKSNKTYKPVLAN